MLLHAAGAKRGLLSFVTIETESARIFAGRVESRFEGDPGERRRRDSYYEFVARYRRCFFKGAIRKSFDTPDGYLGRNYLCANLILKNCSYV